MSNSDIFYSYKSYYLAQSWNEEMVSNSEPLSIISLENPHLIKVDWFKYGPVYIPHQSFEQA